MGAFEAARACSELRNRDCGSVVNKEGAGLELFGCINKAAELCFVHVALADFVARNFRRLGKNTARELLGAHFKREEADHAAI